MSSSPAEPGMRRPEMVRVGTPALPNAAGLNRFFWDYRLHGPWSAQPESERPQRPARRAGFVSRAADLGQWNATQPLVIKADPRATADGITLALLHEQLEHNCARAIW